jgi:hypothetical protein
LSIDPERLKVLAAERHHAKAALGAARVLVYVSHVVIALFFTYATLTFLFMFYEVPPFKIIGWGTLLFWAAVLYPIRLAADAAEERREFGLQAVQASMLAFICLPLGLVLLVYLNMTENVGLARTLYVLTGCFIAYCVFLIWGLHRGAVAIRWLRADQTERLPGAFPVLTGGAPTHIHQAPGYVLPPRPKR